MSHNINILEALGFAKGGNRVAEKSNSDIEGLVKSDSFNKHADFTKDLAHFEDVADGRFTNSSSGRNTLLNQMKTHIENHEDMQNVLNEINVEGVGKSGKLDKMSDKAVGQLKKNANRLYTAADKLEQKHTKGIKLLAEAKTDAMKDLSEKYFEAREAVATLDVSTGSKTAKVHGSTINVSNEKAKKDLLSTLEKNFEKTSEQIGKIYDKKLDAHKETLSELKGLVSEVETKTGITKGASTVAKDAAAIEKAGGAAAKAEGTALKAGTGASLGIVAGTTAIGGVIGHQFDKDGSQTGTWIGALTGGVTGFVAKNNIAKMLNIASHAR